MVPTDAPARFRTGSFDGQEVALRVHGDNLQIPHGDALTPHVARHPGAFEHSARGRASANRARSPPTIGLTVGLRTTVKAVTLHGSCETTAFGCRRYVDVLTRLEQRHIEFLPELELRIRVHRELTQITQRRQAFQMSELGLRQSLRLLVPNLGRHVAVALLGLDLRHITRAQGHNRCANDGPLGIDESTHAQLSS
jgi:hypothetical protein